MPTKRSRRGPVTDVLGGLADSAYVPALAIGGALQFAAVFPGSAPLAAAGLMLGAGADLLTANEAHPWRGRLRRAGLGVVQRASLRLLLLLASITSQAVPPATAAWFVVAAVSAVAASRVWRWSLDKVVATEPAMGVRNLGGDGTLTGLFESTARRRTIGSGILVAAELPVGMAMLAGAEGLVAGTTVRVALAVMTTLAVVAAAGAFGWSARFRRSGRVEGHLEVLRRELGEHGAPVIAYFTGAEDTTYQLNQWVPVLDRLTVPVLYVLRERHHLERLVPTRWPVLYCRTTRDVEEALTPSARVALYVSNAGKNIHLQRYAQLKHVFLNHGDSDKASSANPVVRVYDLLFVAGEIAIDRYRDAGVDIPRDRFRIVGRPQLDGVQSRPQPPIEGPATLLYAPTWEGLFDEADYSSVERMGVELVQTILRHRPDVRIVFKPHPMSGTVRQGARRAGTRIEDVLREAGAPHVVASDYPAVNLLGWFDRSDVLLADISAVATDWLATSRPYLLTNPLPVPLDEFHRQYPSHAAAYLVDPTLETLAASLDEAFGDDRLGGARVEMARRVLGDHPDGPQATFDRVVLEVIEFARSRPMVDIGHRFQSEDAGDRGSEGA